jgi:hypothetical protein
MMLARKLTYFNTKTLTLNLANLELGEGFRNFLFILFQSSLYFFLKNWDLILWNDEINMLWKRSKKWWMKGGEIKIKYANGGRMAENEIWDNYQFILPTRASHFTYVSKTVSIPEDLGC